MMNLIETLRNAGVVGAGGAGFPTYRKIDAKVELVIANGAECEPLFEKDKALMEHYPAEIIGGMMDIMKHAGAARGIVAIKSKNTKSIRTIREHLPANISIFEMEDVYPAGDEYEVVFHSTGKRIPAGGFPIDIGIIVQNVETLYNVHHAVSGKPVTHSMMTVHGHVQKPFTAWFPLGMLYRDVLQAAGGVTIDDFVLIDGGPMMGKVVADLSIPVTRTSAGFIVLPRESKLAIRKSQPEQAFKRFGKSTCDQCSLCTEMCPRYLMGYPIKPHLVMRSLLTTGEMSESLNIWAQACCECNICSLWACPEELDPKNVCVTTKRDLKKNNQWLSPEALQKLTTEPHQLKDYRSVPTKRLRRRLGLDQFSQAATFNPDPIKPQTVSIPLQQHIGKVPVSVVTQGDRVRVGDPIAKPGDDDLSVAVHASIDGTVTAVNHAVIIQK